MRNAISVTTPLSILGVPLRRQSHLPIEPRIQLHQLLADGFDLLLGRQGLRGFDPGLEGGVEVGELGRSDRLAELASVVFLPELGGGQVALSVTASTNGLEALHLADYVQPLGDVLGGDAEHQSRFVPSSGVKSGLSAWRGTTASSEASLAAATDRTPACCRNSRSVRGIPCSGDRSDTCVAAANSDTPEASLRAATDRIPAYSRTRYVSGIPASGDRSDTVPCSCNCRQFHPCQRRQVGQFALAFPTQFSETASIPPTPAPAKCRSRCPSRTRTPSPRPSRSSACLPCTSLSASHQTPDSTPSASC